MGARGVSQRRNGHGPTGPEGVVQRQLEAYNLRRLEPFLDCFAEDAELRGFPDQALLRGREALRARYRTLFDAHPEAHATLLHRAVHGDRVVDHVHFHGQGLEATLVHEVDGGLVRRLWLIL